MTVIEAAKVLGLSRRTLLAQIRNGRLAAVHHGRDWWIEDAEVARYERESLGKPGRRAK